LQEAIAVEPRKVQHRIMLASFYMQIDQLDKAEKTLRESIQADPEDMDRYMVLSEFLASRRTAAQAETELLAAIKANPKAHKLRFGLAKLYEQGGAGDKAAQVYRDVIGAAGEKLDGLAARNRLANLLFRQGGRDEAGKLVEEVLKENPRDNEALFIKGKLALVKNDAQGAIASARSVLKDQPNSVEALSLLADAHMMNKEPELAKESLQKAIEMNPQNMAVRLAMAKFLAQTGDLNGSLKKIEELLKLSPNDLDALMAKIELLAAKKDMKGVQATLVKIKTAYPDKPIGYFQLGQFYASQKKYDDAIREYEQALKRSTDTYPILSAIVNVSIGQGKPDKAVKRLNDILKETPAHPFAHELLAEVYITQKKYTEAEKELQEAIKVSPKWNVPYRNLANLHLVRGEFPAAEKIYQQGLQVMPEDAELLFHLAGAHERTHDYDKAIATYERVLKKNVDQMVAANNLASLLTDRKGDAKSLKRAKELALRFETSQQPAFRDTLGWVYYKSGEVDKAIALLESVVKQVPKAPIFHYHLGMAYHKKGDNAAAKTHLAKAVEDKNDFPGKDEAQATLKKIP